jgi:DNA repair protein RecN (Recombination protein N)
MRTARRRARRDRRPLDSQRHGATAVLTELHVENLGVIERLELVFGPGLTALTGETGAGKTMLVEAIELLVGGRADATVVRPGASEARVDGRFVLADADATGNDEVELVLTRIVPRDGRSRAYVNGRLATVASLAELTDRAVDLHGQHAHQSLLAPATQRAALDRFGGIDRAPLRAARARLTELDAELAALGGDERARARELDLLRFQVDELDAAGIDDPDEDRVLAAGEELLADAVAHREAGLAAIAVLTDDGGGRDALGSGLATLGGRSPYDDVAGRLRDVLADVDDVISELRRRVEAIEEDPERLEDVRGRRRLLRDLCRKYGDDLAAVMEYHAEAAERLARLERFDERAAELDRARREALAELRTAAAAVGDARRLAAPALASAVEAHLRTLAMPHASVAVDVTDAVDGEGDGERVQFLLAANPGAPMLPLNRVASGGELARAMLALRLVLTASASPRQAGSPAMTLVFDEVDAGIGGAAAVAVGRALADLRTHHQVLVVTHLPQVAAVADAHVVVTKQVERGLEGPSTTATATLVDGDRRVDEIARMLSGRATEPARRHALELLQ